MEAAENPGRSPGGEDPGGWGGGAHPPAAETIGGAWGLCNIVLSFSASDYCQCKEGTPNHACRMFTWPSPNRTVSSPRKPQIGAHSQNTPDVFCYLSVCFSSFLYFQFRLKSDRHKKQSIFTQKHRTQPTILCRAPAARCWLKLEVFAATSFHIKQNQLKLCFLRYSSRTSRLLLLLPAKQQSCMKRTGNVLRSD